MDVYKVKDLETQIKKLYLTIKNTNFYNKEEARNTFD